MLFLVYMLPMAVQMLVPVTHHPSCSLTRWGVTGVSNWTTWKGNGVTFQKSGTTSLC
jgi:hypothetical protein